MQEAGNAYRLADWQAPDTREITSFIVAEQWTAG